MKDYSPVGPSADFVRAPILAETEADFGEFFSAQAGNVIRDSPVSSIFRAGELSTANREYEPDPFASEFGEMNTGIPTGRKRTVTAEVANAQAAEAGVKVNFGEANYTPEAIAIMIDRAKRRHVRDTIIASYKPSMGTTLGVSLLTSLADPLNIAVGFIPVVGQARYAGMLAKAGTFAGRTQVRFAVGAAEGVAGAALIEPLIAGAALQEGRDYTATMALGNLAFGGLLGSGMHASLGGIGEKLFSRRFEPVSTPADVIDRIPQEINEAAFRAAISDMIEGRPVQSAEIIDAFMSMNPDAAKSISYAQTLRYGGPSIDDVDARVKWWRQQLEEISGPVKGLSDEKKRFKRHVKELIDGSGVKKKASRAVKARAIVGRETHLITSERARIMQAIDKMVSRNKSYKNNSEFKPKAVKEFKPEPIKRQTSDSNQVPEIGDVVNVLSGKERIISTSKPVTLTRVLDDPVYGTYGFIEGSSTGIPIKDIEIVNKGGMTKETKTKVDDSNIGNVSAANPIARIVETPPAKINTLSIAELELATKQYDELQAQTRRRLDSILERLPEETAKGIETQLSKIETEVSSLENVYQAATSCMLKGP